MAKPTDVNSPNDPTLSVGEVVRLDRDYPLVVLPNGERLRGEHSTALLKRDRRRAVIGDRVQVSLPEGHDKVIIEEILPRSCEFVRKDPTERAVPQVLAANFESVLIAQPASELNDRRLERELVLAHSTGACVIIALTKADLAEGQTLDEVLTRAQGLAGDSVEVFLVSVDDPASLDPLRQRLTGQTTILLGRSGVGKSSLVNALLGESVQATGDVRTRDGKGRHTTVSREIIQLPGGGRIVDMPGVRGLGLWDSEEGIDRAFDDISSRAESCRFRDCLHEKEPGCAVQQAIAEGELSPVRLESFLRMKEEIRTLNQRREEARWQKGEKKSQPARSGPRRKRK